MKKAYITPAVAEELVNVESMMAASYTEKPADENPDGFQMEGKGRDGWSDNGLW